MNTVFGEIVTVFKDAPKQIFWVTSVCTSRIRVDIGQYDSTPDDVWSKSKVRESAVHRLALGCRV